MLAVQDGLLVYLPQKLHIFKIYTSLTCLIRNSFVRTLQHAIMGVSTQPEIVSSAWAGLRVN